MDVQPTLLENRLARSKSRGPMFPALIAMLLASCFGLAVYVPVLFRNSSLFLAFTTIGLVAVAIGVWGVYVSIPKSQENFAIAKLVGFFILSSYLFFLISETTFSRYGGALIAAGLVGIFISNLSFAFHIGEYVSFKSFVPLVSTMEILATFFLAYFLYTASKIIQVNILFSTVIFGLIIAALGRYGSRVYDLKDGDKLIRIVGGVLSAQIFIAISFLPTSALVNAAVFVLVINAAIFAIRNAFLGKGFGLWWKTIVFAAGLLLVVFVTADWL